MKRLAKAFHKYQDEEQFCRVVDLKEIEENDFNLNIARYVQVTEPEPPVDVKKEFKVLQELIKKQDDAEKKMIKYVKELG